MINYSVYTHRHYLDATTAPKAYARAQVRETVSFERFIDLMALRNTAFSRGAIEGVISDLCLCIVEQLLEGRKVQLGDLGKFWISLSCNAADSMETFTDKNITAVNVVFTPGKCFENFMERATFNPVSSRKAQHATLRIEKSGGTTVDLKTSSP